MSLTNNPSFDFAYRTANVLMRNRNRLLMLSNQLLGTLSGIKDKQGVIHENKKKLLVLGRLLKAFATGHYKAIPWRMMLGVVATLIYFINPVDLVPDFIPITGFVDDFTILLWMYKATESEIDKFLVWENVQP